MLVKNWNQVFKSLAVWFPILASAVYVLLQNSTEAGLIPLEYLPFVVGVSTALGWVIPQKSIKKGDNL